MTPGCQPDIKLSVRASSPLHLWRNRWQKCFKKDLNRMATCCFFSLPRDKGLWRVWGQLLKPLRQMRGEACEWMWQPYYNGHISDIYYSFTISYPPLPSVIISFIGSPSNEKTEQHLQAMKCVTSLSMTPSNWSPLSRCHLSCSFYITPGGKDMRAPFPSGTISQV